MLKVQTSSRRPSAIRRITGTRSSAQNIPQLILQVWGCFLSRVHVLLMSLTATPTIESEVGRNLSLPGRAIPAGLVAQAVRGDAAIERGTAAETTEG